MNTITFMAQTLDESEYPAYRVSLTAPAINTLFSAGILDIDPSYQRGKTSATRRKPATPIQATPRSTTHIEGLCHDLISVAPTGKSIAVLPPIWVNARRIQGDSKLSFQPDNSRGYTGDLELSGDKKLYCFDGWHRVLAIKKSWNDGQLSPDRRFVFYIFDAPVEFEARAFRLLNAQALPVDRTRVAWVSSPFSKDLWQIAYEFAVVAFEDRLETVKSNVSRTSGALCSFLAVANGFTFPPQTGYKLWPQAEIDPHDPKHRALVVWYMSEFWRRLVEIRPDLGPCTIEQRIASRATSPLLNSSPMIQALLWLGHQYLASWTPQANYLYKLKALSTDLDLQDRFFENLSRLKAAPGQDPLDPGFIKGTILPGLVNARGRLTRNDFRHKRELFWKMAAFLGVDQPWVFSAQPPTKAKRSQRVKGESKRSQTQKKHMLRSTS